MDGNHVNASIMKEMRFKICSSNGFLLKLYNVSGHVYPTTMPMQIASSMCMSMTVVNVSNDHTIRLSTVITTACVGKYSTNPPDEHETNKAPLNRTKSILQHFDPSFLTFFVFKITKYTVKFNLVCM